ncbi:MAG: hypothetical protein RLY16_2643 [Bacteroidota bacterium]|jgi:anti-anti-sigma regulatory factor
MNFKLDTKEKFTVIQLQEPVLSEIMAAEWTSLLLSYLQKDIPHLIINLEQVQEISIPMAESLAVIQQQFYEKECSFVICCLNEKVEATFEEIELLELLNFTPTESEAWDIVQMEEIEREILGGEE